MIHILCFFTQHFTYRHRKACDFGRNSSTTRTRTYVRVFNAGHFQNFRPFFFLVLPADSVFVCVKYVLWRCPEYDAAHPMQRKRNRWEVFVWVCEASIKNLCVFSFRVQMVIVNVDAVFVCLPWTRFSDLRAQTLGKLFLCWLRKY